MPRCNTGQLAVARTEFGTGESVSGWILTFKDKHATWAKKCVGEPCEVNNHAEFRMVLHFATSNRSLSKAILTLKHPPCLACARLLTNLQLLRIDFKRGAENDEEQSAWEMLATKVHIDVVRPKSARLGKKASPSTPEDEKAADPA